MNKAKSFKALLCGGAPQAAAQKRGFAIMKSDDEKRLVFGWASVAVRVDGETIVDYQEDIIEIEELEKAAYAFTANFGTAGEMLERADVGRLIGVVKRTVRDH